MDMFTVAIFGFYSDFIVTDRPFVVTDYGKDIPVVSEPYEPQPKPAVKKTFKPYVLMFTMDSCGPCKNFKRTEEPKIKAAGYEVRHVTGSGLSGIPSVPRFVVITKDNENITFSKLANGDEAYKGFTTAEILLSKLREAESKPTISSQQVRWTTQELRDYVKDNYSQDTPFERGYMAKGHESQVWIHLISHGFSLDQVEKLTMREAMCVHDAAHPKLNKQGVEISPPLLTPFKD